MKIDTKLSEPELDDPRSNHRGLFPVHTRNTHQYHQHHHHRPIKTSLSSLPGDQDDDQSPPTSPALRLPPHCFSSNSSISSWNSRAGSESSSEDGDVCNNIGGSGSQSGSQNNNNSNNSSSSNSKEDRVSYSTRFARYHLETYRQNDRMRWNFDFEHNRPLDDQHHHHHQAVARYQWEPAL